MQNPIRLLRHVGYAEGVSFLILVVVAMPLKYVWAMPQPVKVFGWLHGVLFMAYCYALFQAAVMARWEVKRTALFFIAALLPLGPFLVDRQAKAYEADYGARRDKNAPR